MRRLALLAVLLLADAVPAFALEELVIRRNGRDVQLSGKVVVTAEDGGILLETPDGVLWTVRPDELVKRTTNNLDFEPLEPDAVVARMLRELPPRFEVHRTAHYLVFYNTSKAYATWCGSLFERLYMAFTNYWSKRGFELVEPKYPMVAIVFSDRHDYLKHSARELGDAAESIIGYYNMETNRVTMYDLTGTEAGRSADDRRGSAAAINQLLSSPDAARTVATIVHEATHQIAFNSGLQRRYSDVPLWVSEGIAVYFETPDLKSQRGWKTIGAVNYPRLDRFRRYLQAQPSDSLKSLLADDSRFRDSQRAEDAYAEAWALNYFLMRQYPDQYRSYVDLLARKTPLVWDDASTRLAEFKAAFGENLGQLESEFHRYISRVR